MHLSYETEYKDMFTVINNKAERGTDSVVFRVTGIWFLSEFILVTAPKDIKMTVMHLWWTDALKCVSAFFHALQLLEIARVHPNSAVLQSQCRPKHYHVRCYDLIATDNITHNLCVRIHHLMQIKGHVKMWL